MKDDLEFIKNFNKITYRAICKKVGVDENNLRAGRTTPENIKKVRREIEKEFAELYLK